MDAELVDFFKLYVSILLLRNGFAESIVLFNVHSYLLRNIPMSDLLSELLSIKNSKRVISLIRYICGRLYCSKVNQGFKQVVGNGECSWIVQQLYQQDKMVS